ncbi:MAG TPA: hypothetical protein VL332_04945 [Candidatus Saccharimonadaceae bacterium]|jgi:DNA-directed RNA polymerase specialized sigma24 family protein|nr:hypothetical protein [Candidatus Saccharimonadaceae bacterium]
MEIPELTAPDAYVLSSEQLREIREVILRSVRFQLQSSSPEVIEDTTYDAVLGVLVFVRRNGLPDRLDKLATTIARNKCRDVMRRRKVWGHAVDVTEYADVVADAHALDWLVELEEGTTLIAARAAEYYRRHKAPCVELTVAVMMGKDFKELAAETNQSHDKLRQRWVRCKARLKAAIARGEPGLEGMPGWKGGVA